MPLRRLLPLLLPLAPTVRAQPTPTCPFYDYQLATADLDVGGVRARLYNDGHLFWRGNAPDGYNVPKSPLPDRRPLAAFVDGLWVGGKVGGETRWSVVNLGPTNFQPGPVNAAGTDAADCAAYDHVWVVSAGDVRAYERTGQATADLAAWPAHLGAPVVDGDGVAGNYNLAGGDRPEIRGHQTAFWVMNDYGSRNGGSAAALGVEVRVTAYAFRSDDPALDYATAYRYDVVNRGPLPITDAYVGRYFVTDLVRGDEQVGSDSTLGLAYVYDPDDLDEGPNGYGAHPPALGYTFLDGPPTRDTDGDGTADAPGASSFLVWYSSTGPNGHPRGEGYYRYLTGRWQDGRALHPCQNGYDDPTCGASTRFVYSGDAVAGTGWVEGAGCLCDSNFGVLSTGPFALAPGATQTATVAMLWARGTSNLDSITKLKAAARSVQAVYDATGFLGLPERDPVMTDAPSAASVPAALALGPAAPNPAATAARVAFGLPAAGRATVALYDVLGRRVATLADGPYGAGWHAATVAAGALAPGVYVVRVEAGGRALARPLVVAR